MSRRFREILSLREKRTLFNQHLRPVLLDLQYPVILGDAREGRNKPEPRISPLQLPECIHERSIFQVAVRVEQKDRMTESLRCSVSNRNAIVSSATSVRPSSVLW